MNIEIADHLNLVRHTINKYKYTPPHDMDEDDLFQIGCMGLMNAIKTFDPSQNTKFATHAVLLIRQEFIRTFTRYSKAKRQKIHTVQIDQKIKETNAVLLETITDHYSLEEVVMNQERIQEAMRIEPLITRYLMDGCTQKEIGQKMGITHQRVSKQIIDMRKKLMA
ncbi:hypothetical protein ABH14_16850 [Brevibacillus brevis]|uniref:sigma-70 family RNA polymerase sigma factor n=1 Tax=Brevibacillus brevis TaxID=1393 RepID=UPI001901AB67|nr:sigma-70 family RNA polymerase sigma factor [Brevibacillus brevis]MBH0331445.1 hypothetical protein [Brevibacillus brevis]